MVQKNIGVVSFGDSFGLEGSSAEDGWQWHQPFVRAACWLTGCADLNWRGDEMCVSALTVHLTGHPERRPRPPPCSHHLSEMGVMMIKSALKHSVCVCVCAHENDFTCVCLLPSSSAWVCMWVCDACVGVYTGLSRLFCSGVYLCLSPPPTHQSLHTNSSLSSEPTAKCQRWQLHKSWVALLNYNLFPASKEKNSPFDT